MKTLAFLFLSLLITLACCNNSESKEKSESEVDTSVLFTNNETVTEAEVNEEAEFSVDTFVLVTEEQRKAAESMIGEEDMILDFDNFPENYSEAFKFLEAFVSKKELVVFKRAPEKYKSISTDTALINFYLNDVIFMKEAVYNGMHKSFPVVKDAADPAWAWKWISVFYPYIYTEWECSECESEAFVLQTELINKAKTTKGNLDDIAFSLLVDHNLLGHGNAGCDYCGYWILGDGSTTALIREVIVMEKASNIFDDGLRGIVKALMDIDYACVFGVSKQKVLDEIDALVILQDSTRFDLSNIHKLKKKINNPEEKIIYEATDAEDFQ